MPGRTEFEFGVNPTRPARRLEDDPMRILVLADFSGRSLRAAGTSGSALANRPTVTVDVDNFEEVMARFAPALELPMREGTGTLKLTFKRLDDFHPDALYRRLELFQALRQTRDRLANPATFAQAAAELKQESTQPPPAAEPTATPAEDEAALLERLLGKRPLAPASTPPVEREANEFIKRILAPHIVPAADPRQASFIDSADQAISEQMRWILHQPAFQALEAAWRSVHELVVGLATGPELQLCLLDVTRQELIADVKAAASDLRTSDVYRLLVDRARMPGGQPWSLLVGDYSFGTGAEDVALLAALGAIGAQAGGPFLAAAKPEVLGCRTLVENPNPEHWLPLDADAGQRWQALRGSWMAAWLGLALPRVLVRLPYGKQTDPIESFDFEELADRRDHEACLWGNPAFFCALLLAQAFLDSSWSMQPGDCVEVTDLPAYTYKEGGETIFQPCAEVLLGERATQGMLERGVMPLLSYRNRNAIRLARFQSLAEPAASLSGPWA